MNHEIVVPSEVMLSVKPWQTEVYRIEAYLAEQGWPFHNSDVTNQSERLSTTLDRTKLKFEHQPDRSVKVTYEGKIIPRTKSDTERRQNRKRKIQP